MKRQLAGASQMQLKRLAPAKAPELRRVSRGEPVCENQSVLAGGSAETRCAMSYVFKPSELRPAPRLADCWKSAGAEPSLEEILADPVLHLVMRRDGVSLAELRNIIAAAQARRREASPCRCPV